MEGIGTGSGEPSHAWGAFSATGAASDLTEPLGAWSLVHEPRLRALQVQTSRAAAPGDRRPRSPGAACSGAVGRPPMSNAAFRADSCGD